MLGRSVGITDDQFAAMADSADSPHFDATDKLVLRYAEVLTRDNRVDDALYAELSARFPKDELIELCMTVALAAFVNRVHATFQTNVDESTDDFLGDDAPACPIGR
jgi:alkylhydroperoxidase family enzyme